MVEIIEQKEIEAWFDYEAGEDEAYFLRFTPPEELKSKSEFEIFDTMVQGWKGVLKDGKPLVCNTANKYALFMHDIQASDAARYWWVYRKACTMLNFVDLKKTLIALNAPSSGDSTSHKPQSNGAKSAKQNAIA